MFEENSILVDCEKKDVLYLSVEFKSVVFDLTSGFSLYVIVSSLCPAPAPNLKQARSPMYNGAYASQNLVRMGSVE